ncbi:MAG TPA: LD-carboxypeptidase, partial [Achromobacter sp.]|nr:LD-carboxypeptidase [Achromobacter sp.]
MTLPGMPPFPADSGRRGFLKQGGALCLSALALAGCAGRAPSGRHTSANPAL